MRYSLPPTAACPPERSLKHPVGRARIHPGPKAAARIGRRIAAPHQLQRPPELPFGILRGRQQHGRAGPQQPDHGLYYWCAPHPACRRSTRARKNASRGVSDARPHNRKEMATIWTCTHPSPGPCPEDVLSLKSDADTQAREKSPFHFPHIHQFTDGA